MRELENTLTKAVALCPGDILTNELFEELKQNLPQIEEQYPSSSLSLQDMEYQHVLNVLESVDGHKGKACDILKISRPRLQRILERLES